jgi:hypothetical protein
MSDSYTFGRKKMSDQQNMEKIQEAAGMAEALSNENLDDFKGNRPQPPMNPGMNPAVQGNIPKEFLNEVNKIAGAGRTEHQQTFSNTPVNPVGVDAHFQNILSKLDTNNYEEIQLPSMGRFYDGNNGPVDGKLHIRPMTGEEEQILASQRLSVKGQSINMILERCIQEPFRAQDYLVVDRTYLLIYLRGISYTVEYPVELTCDSCDSKFDYSIMLNELNIDDCPEGFGPVLSDVLPKSGYRFSYRLPTGTDDVNVTDHREQRIKRFGKNAEDDTLLFRSAMLLNEIEGVNDKKKLEILLRKLPILDVNYIRTSTMDVPFGVNTKINVGCPNCMNEFTVELPYESNFFFPRKKERET